MTLNKCHTRKLSLWIIIFFFLFVLYLSLLLADARHSGVKSSLATIMLLLPLLVSFPLLFNLMFAMQNSALYRSPTSDLSFGNFKRDPFHYLWAEKLSSSMMRDQLDCGFLCVGEPNCYSFNMAAYPDSKGLYLCELLATDKYREAEKVHANATFHHCSPSVRSLHIFGA